MEGGATMLDILLTDEQRALRDEARTLFIGQ
jgi:hypothetical protein